MFANRLCRSLYFFRQSSRFSSLVRSQIVTRKCLINRRIVFPTTTSFLLPARTMTEESMKQINAKELLETVEKMKNQNEDTMIIDVREVKEIEETGIIPGGINIPLGEIEKAFLMSPEEFSLRYNRPKPTRDTKLIFSCRSGKRSAMALEKIKKLNYNNLYNFSGGWLGYEEYIKSKREA